MIIHFQNESFQYDFEHSFHKAESGSTHQNDFLTINFKKQDPNKDWSKDFDGFEYQVRFFKINSFLIKIGIIFSR